MPLVLSLRETEDFFVGDKRFEVLTIHHPMKFDVRDCDTGEVYDVNSKQGTEICQDVYVSAGNHPQSSTVRLAIDAPAEVILLRGEKKRALDSEQA